MDQVRYDTEFALIHAPPSKDQPVDWAKVADDEYANKRINSKVLKHRAQPKQRFEADQFKASALEHMAKSADVASFRESCNRSIRSSQGGSRAGPPSGQAPPSPRRAEPEARSRPVTIERADTGLTELEEREAAEEKEKNDQQKQKAAGREQRNAEREAERQLVVAAKLTDDRTQARQGRIGAILGERAAKKETPSFVAEYFRSNGGETFLGGNPPVAPSEEMLTRMRQRMERNRVARPDREAHGSGLDNGHQSVKGSQGQNANGSMEGGGSQERSNDLVMVGDAIDDKDNPIVALEPDENLKQGSAFMGSKKAGTSIGPGDGSLHEGMDATVTAGQTLPSLYMQEKIYLYSKDQEALLKAEEHHIVKTKDFNVYGRLREEQPQVKSLAKSSAQTELNEKFITTECITDRRVKISSMAPRYYVNAPSVSDVRKQGQHQMILSAINKKQTFAELINQANSMVTGVLHDGLKRSLNVMPASVQFGALRAGTHNEIVMTLKNEDSIAQRVTIKPTMDKRISVRQEEYGIIAPGMIKKVIVSISVGEDEPGLPASIKDVVTIVSKHDVFKIPVAATLMSLDQFAEENKQQVEQGGRPIQNSRVRERLARALAESRASQRSDEPELLTKRPKGGADDGGEDPILAEVRRQQRARESAEGTADDPGSRQPSQHQ